MKPADFTLGQQQSAALPRFEEWWDLVQAKDPRARPFFYVAGYAGTGKTTLAEVLIGRIGLTPGDVAGGAMQANAANRLHQITGWDCRTLHRWNYRVEQTVGGGARFVLHPDSPIRKLRLLVMDEVSQVSTDLWRDTLAHRVPILVLGDPGQLRPVSGEAVAPYLAPDVILTEIHRQALQSPIVRGSMVVRSGADLPYGDYFNEATGELELRKVPISSLSPTDVMAADVVLTGRNATRIGQNHWYRAQMGYNTPLPGVGERVTCLRNQLDYALVNGFSGTVIEPGESTGVFSYKMSVRLDEEGVVVPGRACLKELIAPTPNSCPDFLRRGLSCFDFGYAKTVHRFIGNQADRVILIDEHPDKPGRVEWLYTGMTRAIRHLTIAVP